jgi:hypothetical protein
MKITDKQAVDIMRSWEMNESSMVDLAEKYRVTRQCIYKVLLRYGANVTKRRIPVSCCTCQKEIVRPRKQLRDRKRVFCSPACYAAWLKARAGYGDSSYGSRMARIKVGELFNLQEGHIVHHVDGNGLNNVLDNIVVYRNQGDHIRAHRGFDAEPIWVGAEHV